MKISYSLSFMVNFFSMTLLLIGFGLFGMPELAADIGIVHGATLALFYAFSGNARSIVLNKEKNISIQALLLGRLLLVIPLSLVSYYLVISVSSVELFLAIILVSRRAFEWLSDVYLSEIELNNTERLSKEYIFFQIVLIIPTFILGVTASSYFLYMLLIWAFSPLLFSATYLFNKNYDVKRLQQTWLHLIPHMGSTAIIGVTVYIFRLLIILFAGKVVAGDLFTAFAIGGLLGSVFANGIGPGVAKHEADIQEHYLPFYLRYGLLTSIFVAIVLSVLSFLIPEYLSNITGKSINFWLATSLSLLGGGIMVFAQRIRFRCLQHDAHHDLFVPDVIINLLILISVPFLFYMMGTGSLIILYLLSAVINLLFYMSSYKNYGRSNTRQLMGLTISTWKIIISFLIVLPIFIQAYNGIFISDLIDFKSTGRLVELPLPISIAALFAGLLLFGSYRKAYDGATLVFISFVVMAATILINESSVINETKSRFLLLLQYILPMFGLILGKMYGDDSKNDYSKGFLYLLLILIPLQLIITYLSGNQRLITNVYFFSVYQNYQYVVLILVCAYLISVSVLYKSRYKVSLLILLPLILVYVLAVLSKLAILLLIISIILIFVYLSWNRLAQLPITTYIFSFTAIIFLSYYLFGTQIISYLNVIAGTEESNIFETSSVSERFGYWSFYFNGVTEGVKEFFIGHGAVLNRDNYPSAHNYYLGYWYSFGLLSLTPILFLVFYTVNKIFVYRKTIYKSLDFIVLVGVVLFILFIDNSLKVGLRQPYSGIFSFFIWGVLLAKLDALRAKKIQASMPVPT